MFYLTACSAVSTRVDSVKQILGIGQHADDTKLDPAYRYLRITTAGNTTFILLGDIDKQPDGSVEVYYSSTGETLRFINGRLAGATGLITEWRKVVFATPPAWTAVTEGKVLEWNRVRDVMPGYRYGLEERLAIRRISTPQKSSLVGIPPESLIWFEERIISRSPNGDNLPPSRYAVSFAGKQESVVYGEQCLSPQLCLAWQQWAPRKP